jgi:hypothetical protein
VKDRIVLVYATWSDGMRVGLTCCVLSFVDKEESPNRIVPSRGIKLLKQSALKNLRGDRG